MLGFQLWIYFKEFVIAKEVPFFWVVEIFLIIEKNS